MIAREVRNERSDIEKILSQTVVVRCTVCDTPVDVPKDVELESVSCSQCGSPILERKE